MSAGAIAVRVFAVALAAFYSLAILWATLARRSAKGRKDPGADGPIRFETRAAPRRLRCAVWATVGLGLGFGVVLLMWFGADDPTDRAPSMVNVLAGQTYALFCLMIATREWAGLGLRICERALFHAPPSWMESLATLLREPDGRRISVADVAGVEWIGHDNVGIRLKRGGVASVFFRNRVSSEEQEAARDAVVGFVERATGREVVREVPRAAAPWVTGASH